MTGQQPSGVVERDNGYAWLVAWLLMLAFTMSFIDRQLLNLLIDPIKHDLAVSDTQLSLLQGAGFIVAYLAFGPVFGRLADVARRRNVIVASALLWSVFTMLCGLAHNLPTLFAARAGVGAAEAALGPAAASLLADYFSKERLPRAYSIHFLGPYVGGGLALMLGGMIVGSAASVAAVLPMLAAFKPWQITFIVMGAPGIGLALLLLLIREPPRRSLLDTESVEQERFTLIEVCQFLWRRRAFYAPFVAAMAMIMLTFYCLPAWMPSLFMRTYGVSAKEVGVIYGPLQIFSGCVGVLAGPTVNRLLARRWPKTSVLMCVVFVALAMIAVMVALPFAPTFPAALALSAASTFCYSFPQAIATSALIFATPNRMRGIVGSLYTFCLSGFGLGFGPTIVALVTDYGFKDPALVNFSLPLVCACAGLLGAVFALFALPAFRAIVAEDAQPAASPAGAPVTAS